MTDHKLIADLRDDTYFCDDPTDIHDRAADRLTELGEERDSLVRTNEALTASAEAQREWAKVAELRITELGEDLVAADQNARIIQAGFSELEGELRDRIAELEATLAAVRAAIDDLHHNPPITPRIIRTDLLDILDKEGS